MHAWGLGVRAVTRQSRSHGDRGLPVHGPSPPISRPRPSDKYTHTRWRIVLPVCTCGCYVCDAMGVCCTLSRSKSSMPMGLLFTWL